jgi:hypothetical protein
VLDAPPEKRQEAIDTYNQLHPKETTTDRLEAKAKFDETPEGQEELKRKEDSAVRVATAGTAAKTNINDSPQAIKTEHDKAKATKTGQLEAETDPEMIERQAQLKRALNLATVTGHEKETTVAASRALDAFPDIYKQLPTASERIFGDRWRDFLTGSVGQDPEFAPLRLNLGMLQSLVAKIHVGSRGNSHILKKFEGLFNAKQMNRDTLASSIKELHKWLTRYATLPNIKGGIDLEDVDKATTPKFEFIAH